MLAYDRGDSAGLQILKASFDSGVCYRNGTVIACFGRLPSRLGVFEAGRLVANCGSDPLLAAANRPSSLETRSLALLGSVQVVADMGS